MSRTSPRTRALALAVFPALAAALFPGALFAGRTFFFYDTGLQNLAFRAWWFEQLRAGHFATWCPGMFAGYPLFAETQTGPLYPPTFLLFSLLPATLAFSWSVALHFAFAGTGAYLLARRAGAGVLPAVLAGIAFETSGFLVTHVVHFNLLTGAAWTPWVAWLTLRAADGRPRSGLLLAGAFACLLLGAHPYATLMSALLAALLLAVRAAGSPRALAGAGVALVLVLALGAALAAVQVLPARELIARTPRGAAADWSFLTFGSFGPWAVPAWIAPDLFGTPVDGTFWGGPDWSHFAETCAFVGAGVVALAACALVLRRDRVTAGFAGLGTLAFVLMLGKYTPVYRLLAWVPVVQSTRLPARFSLLFTLALAMLAALGLQAMRDESDARRRRIAIGVATAVLVLLALGATLASAPARVPDAELAATGRAFAKELPAIASAAQHAWTRTLVVALAAVAALLPFARRRPPAWAAAAAVVVVLLDLFTWGRDFNPVIPASVLREPPPAVTVLPRREPRPRIFRQGLDEIWTRGREIPRTDLVTPNWRGHEDSYASATWSLAPNSQLLWDVESGEGFTSLPPLQWLEWMGLADRPGATPHPDLSQAQADLLALDAVLSSGSGIDGEGWEARSLPGDLWLSLNRDPLPRARWAAAWDVRPRAGILAAVRAPDHDPRAAVLLETPPATGAARGAAGGRADEPAAAREKAPGAWEIDARGRQGRVFVLAESWDPGWKATDAAGNALPVLRADGLFVAVALAAATDRIDLRYAPRTVTAGAGISIATSLLCVTLGFLLGRRRFPSLTMESTPTARPAPVVIVVAGAVLTVLCLGARVGGSDVDRRRSSLQAAAARSWTAEAFGALRAGAPDEAVRLLRAAATADPSDASLAYRLGLAEREAGHPTEAVAAFRHALSIDAGFDAAREALHAVQGAP